MTTDKPKNFLFVLLDQFTLLAFSSAIEPLRVANRVADRPVYSWSLLSEDGQPVNCSGDVSVTVDDGLRETARDDTIVICGGMNVQQATTRPILNWLRREARRGVSVAGVCTGAYTLATAGLLDNRKATIHWENQDAFIENFENVSLSKSVFVIDHNRMTAAGGTSSIDLMLAVIANDYGEEFASQVADRMIYSAIRTSQDSQRVSIPTRIGVRHPKLGMVIQIMEENLEEPFSPSALAAEVGLSTRQLERLFRRYLNRSPKRYYMELRLQKARNLLLQTDMSVINVALACGFASPSHFSKCYRTQYQTTPYRERGTRAARLPV